MVCMKPESRAKKSTVFLLHVHALERPASLWGGEMKDPKNVVNKAIGVQTEEWNFNESPRKHSTVHVLRLVGDVLRLVVLRSSNDWHN